MVALEQTCARQPILQAASIHQIKAAGGLGGSQLHHHDDGVC
jgi:hypothetical protein